eukprot:jgi/Mesvir1/1648/Mv14611-RA.1
MDDGSAGHGQAGRGAQAKSLTLADAAGHAGSSDARGQMQNVHTADKAVLLEVMELRAENKALQARAEQLEARLLVRDLQQQIRDGGNDMAPRLPPKGRGGPSAAGAAPRRSRVQSLGGAPGSASTAKPGRKSLSRDASGQQKSGGPVITGMLSLEDLKGVLLGAGSSRGASAPALPTPNSARLASRHGMPDGTLSASLPAGARRPTSAIEDLSSTRSLRISTTGKLLGSSYSLPAMEVVSTERTPLAVTSEAPGRDGTVHATSTHPQGAPAPGDTAYAMGQLGELMRQRNELSRTHLRRL